MGRIEKTVFISYRRTNAPWALAIFQNLTNHGYDVFFDFNGIAGGDFESVILENVRSRAHFIVLLTPSALERCAEPNDWLRREMETAMDERRNMVPLMLDGFDFGSPAIAGQLTGKLGALKHYNGLRVPTEYFMEAMERLRGKYLNVALDAVLHPASLTAAQIAKEQQVAAVAAPRVREEELTAQAWFERGFAATDPDEQIRFNTEAIRLNPDFAVAFYNRGVARQDKGDIDGALLDYSEVIRLKPRDAQAFNNRGNIREAKGDLDGALQDYTEAIRLKPNSVLAFNNRGAARHDRGDLDGALQDYTEAIRLKPNYEDAFYNRGLAGRDKGDLDGALLDFTEAIRLNPDSAEAFYNRGLVRRDKGDLDGALQDYTEVTRLDPNYEDAFYNRGAVWEARSNFAAAIADYQKYLDLGGGLRDGDQAEVEEAIRDLRTRL
jgi:tetratricopeptide (TPR) repeat protein